MRTFSRNQSIVADCIRRVSIAGSGWRLSPDDGARAMRDADFTKLANVIFGQNQLRNEHLLSK
jgi:uncharacterized protein (DUF2384 family)